MLVGIFSYGNRNSRCTIQPGTRSFSDDGPSWLRARAVGMRLTSLPGGNYGWRWFTIGKDGRDHPLSSNTRPRLRLRERPSTRSSFPKWKRICFRDLVGRKLVGRMDGLNVTGQVPPGTNGRIRMWRKGGWIALCDASENAYGLVGRETDSFVVPKQKRKSVSRGAGNPAGSA
jgi:hypothetical protein